MSRGCSMEQKHSWANIMNPPSHPVSKGRNRLLVQNLKSGRAQNNKIKQKRTKKRLHSLMLLSYSLLHILKLIFLNTISRFITDFSGTPYSVLAVVIQASHLGSKTGGELTSNHCSSGGLLCSPHRSHNNELIFTHSVFWQGVSFIMAKRTKVIKPSGTIYVHIL